MLHEELRRAREKLGWSQAQLAARAGIPRNQIVRAEKGENITLDTLRKIAALLPVTELTLLDRVKLTTDTLPIHDKLYVGAVLTLHQMMEALSAGLDHTQDIYNSLENARRHLTAEEAAERGADVDPTILFKRIEHALQTVRERMKDTA